MMPRFLSQSLSEAPKHGLKNIHDPSNLCPQPCT